MVVKNCPGGSGMVGLQTLMRDPVDGHTLLMPSSGGMSVLPLIHGERYSAKASLSLIEFLSQYCFSLVTAPQSPFNSFAELLRYSKANPGKISIAHAGVGATNHIAAEYLNLVSGTDSSSPLRWRCSHAHRRAGTACVIGPSGNGVCAADGEKWEAQGHRNHRQGARRVSPRGSYAARTWRECRSEILQLHSSPPTGLPQHLSQQIAKDVRKALVSSEMQGLLESGGLTTEPLSGQQLEKRIEIDAVADANVVRWANIKLS